ncbi:MAG: hypothetical protein ACLQLH_16990 [Terracidiphilus sp.]
MQAGCLDEDVTATADNRHGGNDLYFAELFSTNKEISDGTYDAANQLKTVVQVDSPYSSNNTTTYGYDNDGNQTSMTDENGHTTTSIYDQLRRLTSRTLPDSSLTETRQYDAAGNLTSLTHFNGVTTTYTYDALNRHHVADHLPRHCKCRPVGISSLQLALSDYRQFR